jgi:hypothetical protein
MAKKIPRLPLIERSLIPSIISEWLWQENRMIFSSYRNDYPVILLDAFTIENEEYWKEYQKGFDKGYKFEFIPFIDTPEARKLFVASTIIQGVSVIRYINDSTIDTEFIREYGERMGKLYKAFYVVLENPLFYVEAFQKEQLIYEEEKQKDSFQWRARPEVLSKLHYHLIHEKLIAHNTSFDKFKSAFGLALVETNSKIIWLGRPNQLAYLIELLRLHDFIHPDNVWKSAKNHFERASNLQQIRNAFCDTKRGKPIHSEVIEKLVQTLTFYGA